MNKIILIHYIGVGNLSVLRGKELLESVQEMIPKDKGIISYIVPVQSDTRVECINPKLVSEEDFQEAKKILDRNQKIVDDLVNRIGKKA